MVLESQSPYKTVNLRFLLVIINNELTNLCGNWILQNELERTLFEIKLGRRVRGGSGFRISRRRDLYLSVETRSRVEL
jgi:hypothetical protein